MDTLEVANPLSGVGDTRESDDQVKQEDDEWEDRSVAGELVDVNGARVEAQGFLREGA